MNKTITVYFSPTHGKGDSVSSSNYEAGTRLVLIKDYFDRSRNVLLKQGVWLEATGNRGYFHTLIRLPEYGCSRQVTYEGIEVRHPDHGLMVIPPRRLRQIANREDV